MLALKHCWENAMPSGRYACRFYSQSDQVTRRDPSHPLTSSHPIDCGVVMQYVYVSAFHTGSGSLARMLSAHPNVVLVRSFTDRIQVILPHSVIFPRSVTLGASGWLWSNVFDWFIIDQFQAQDSMHGAPLHRMQAVYPTGDPPGDIGQVWDIGHMCRNSFSNPGFV